MKRLSRRLTALLFSVVLLCTLCTPANAASPVQTRTLTLDTRDPAWNDGPPQELLSAEQLPRLRDARAYGDYLTGWDEVEVALRQQLCTFGTTASVSVAANTSYDINELAWDVLDAGCKHTGVPTEGDYLRGNYVGANVKMSWYTIGTTNYVTFTYTMDWATTPVREAEMNVAVKKLLDELDVYDASDYEKVCAIYDYLCENVTYDYDGLAADDKYAHSAYAALIKGKAVCQGYATLFYRLALELGVDARYISGIGAGGPHGWNIVKLDGKYYNLDATWDAGYSYYQWFLVGDWYFYDHSRDFEYRTVSFYEEYPMSNTNYVPPKVAVSGDIDGNQKVTRDDVIRLLLHVTMPGQFPIDAEADFNGDGKVNRDDVIRLLLHVTMPNQFPLK